MPATLEPPPARSRVRKDIVSRPLQRDSRWNERFVRSGYFLGAVLLHLVIFALVATYVVFKTPAPPPPDGPLKINIPPAAQPISPAAPVPPKEPFVNPSPGAVKLPAENPIRTIRPTDFTVRPPGLDFGPQLPVNPGRSINPQINLNTPSPKLLRQIFEMEEHNWGRPAENIIEGHGQPGNLVAKFTVYLASYADGDWACNTVMDGGTVRAGGLPNLLAKVREWSHGKIQASVEPQPLAIGGPDLLKKPPFIFFTGHKDFRLTDAEVANLREYLAEGGFIWGDNALPGSGSRFDVAFRREMRRVIPDKDTQFQDVPMDHEMFTKNRWFDFQDLPSGMNFYHEPLQHLDLHGKMAILYAPNDYSDLYTLRILPGDRSYEGGWHRGLTLWSNETFLNNSKLFFRNFSLDSCYQSQRLGANIIGYLLVRFDDEMLLNQP